jgi:hypothetical protein
MERRVMLVAAIAIPLAAALAFAVAERLADWCRKGRR